MDYPFIMRVKKMIQLPRFHCLVLLMYNITEAFTGVLVQMFFV